MQKAPPLPITTCFVAGHSGGHIVPCLTMAQKIIVHDKKASIIFFSTINELDKAIIQKHSFVKHVPLAIDKLPGKRFWQWPYFVWQFFRSFFKSLSVLKHTKPSTIKTTGGLVALPVCLAGAMLRIPIELYEVNVHPGRTIKLLAPFADKIFVAFHETKNLLGQNTCYVVPYPIRFSESNRSMSKEQARSVLGLSLHKTTLLVVGGSQGSLFLNNIIKDWIITGAYHNIQIIHQIGIYEQFDWNNFYQEHKIPAIIFSYRNDLDILYQASDTVLSRAGAGLLAELAFFKKECIIVPLEIKGNNHQLFNAQAYTHQHKKLATLVRQHEREYIFASLSAASG